MIPIRSLCPIYISHTSQLIDQFHHCLNSIAQTFLPQDVHMAIMRCIRLEPNRSMNVDEFKAWLRAYDDNHDGRISQEEFREALHGLRIWFGKWKAQKAMESADTNHSGTIDSASEMEKLVKFAQKHLHMKIYES